MSEESEDDDKQHDPTQKKLDDARKRGEVPKSTDLTTAASYFALLVAFVVFGPSNVSAFGNLLASLVANSNEISGQIFNGSGSVFLGGMLLDIGSTVITLFMIPAIAVLAIIVAQQALVFAPDKLAPKLSRISPLANFKQKFGRSGLFEFAKSSVKLVVYSLVLGIFLYRNTDNLIDAVHASPMAAAARMVGLMTEFLIIVFIVAISIGGIDFIWQKFEHIRKNRMSSQDLKDEHKTQEGDPFFKQARRQIGYGIAMTRMLADVPTADVIIVNPEHFAVALKWDKSSGKAPICVAKGVDEIAGQIREIGAKAGVPLRRDPPTARAIYATVDLGEEILEEHYKVVAAAIRFATDMRRKAKSVYSAP